MDGNAKSEGGAQGVRADQVAAVQDSAGPGALCLHDGRGQGAGTVMAVGYYAYLHCEINALSMESIPAAPSMDYRIKLNPGGWCL